MLITVNGIEARGKGFSQGPKRRGENEDTVDVVEEDRGQNELNENILDILYT